MATRWRERPQISTQVPPNHIPFALTYRAAVLYGSCALNFDPFAHTSVAVCVYCVYKCNNYTHKSQKMWYVFCFYSFWYLSLRRHWSSQKAMLVCIHDRMQYYILIFLAFCISYTMRWDILKLFLSYYIVWQNGYWNAGPVWFNRYGCCSIPDRCSEVVLLQFPNRNASNLNLL